VNKQFSFSVSTTKRISETGRQASQIPFERTELSVNVSRCLLNAETQPTMLETPVFDPSAPLILGAEGMSFPLEEIRTLPMEDILMEDQLLNNSVNISNAFNTPTLTTPEIEDFTFDGNFEEFITWNGPANTTGDNLETFTDTLTADTDFSQPEHIWGFKTFDDENIELCAPPSIVEGNVEKEVDEQNLTSIVNIETVDENHPESAFQFENNDVLKWIIDDQRIDDLPILENTQLEINSLPLPEDSTTREIIVQELSLPVKIEVKTEDLGEDEKYRKMRIQNNESSRKCRLNRKRKQQDMEEECKLLEERNVFLKSRVEEMEKEVKAWKQKLLSDISSTSHSKYF